MNIDGCYEIYKTYRKCKLYYTKSISKDNKNEMSEL